MSAIWILEFLLMRSVMAAWVADPNNAALKAQYRDLQRRYQRLFQAYKSGQRKGVATS